jgi:hypothetical protein
MYCHPHGDARVPTLSLQIALRFKIAKLYRPRGFSIGFAEILRISPDFVSGRNLKRRSFVFMVNEMRRIAPANRFGPGVPPTLGHRSEV